MTTNQLLTNRMSIPKKSDQKDYEMANYWKSPKCVILSWVYRLTLGYTRWKTFLAYFYSFCWFFEGLVANLDTKRSVFKTVLYTINLIIYLLISLFSSYHEGNEAVAENEAVAKMVFLMVWRKYQEVKY